LQNAYYYQLSVASTVSAVSEVAVLHCGYAGVFASIVSVCYALENGRYGNAPIRSDTIQPVSVAIRYRYDNRPFSTLHMIKIWTYKNRTGTAVFI